ncbi:MAG: histidine kinase [Planctomycetes bacterium]|nr:histidine kinase [Planctomycetota bacterium]
MRSWLYKVWINVGAGYGLLCLQTTILREVGQACIERHAERLPDAADVQLMVFWLELPLIAFWLAGWRCRSGWRRSWRQSVVFGAGAVALFWLMFFGADWWLSLVASRDAVWVLGEMPAAVGIMPAVILLLGQAAAAKEDHFFGRFVVRQRELQVAQLRALRAQLQPHFLFNTLHSIGVTATRDGHAAQRMTTLLGDMLRHTLADRAGQPIPLREELAALAPYLELQRVRFQDRLQVEVVVPDDLMDILVPDLLLQPLVENAIQHGIEQRPGAGRLRIVAELTHIHFQVRVEDDGVPPPQIGAPPATGTGLSATRERLRVLYGDEAWLELKANELGGTTVVVELPVRRSTHAA